MKIHISEGNEKMGGVPSISLPPGKTCAEGVPCLKSCYARRLGCHRPNLREGWKHNLQMCEFHFQAYFDKIDHFLGWEEPKMFRWHVAGDIPYRDYLGIGMRGIAANHPNVKFVCFTKQHRILASVSHLPENLVVRASMWPGWGVLDGLENYRKAWVSPDPRIPKNARVCPGKCESCNYECWSSKRDVVFPRR